MSLTLIAELLYFSILVMAEIAFSVGLIFSGERDSESVIISTKYGMASPHAPCRQKHKESSQNKKLMHIILHACKHKTKHQPNTSNYTGLQFSFPLHNILKHQTLPVIYTEI
jgi:cytidine deaminase